MDKKQMALDYHGEKKGKIAIAIKTSCENTEDLSLAYTPGVAVPCLEIEKNKDYHIKAKAFGEPLDFKKHNFKVEIKAPTFYDMQIKQESGVFMRFLLDL